MFRRALVMGTVAALVLVPALWAQDKPKDKPPPVKPATAAEEYRAILKDYQSVQQEYFKLLRAAKTTADRQEAAQKAPKTQEFARRLLDLAKGNPKEPVAIDSLVWIAQNAGYAPEANEAVGILTEDHIKSEKLGSIFQRQMYALSPAMEKLARAVLEKSPHKTVQRQACLSLAIHHKNRRQTEEADKLFQRIVDEFADLDSLIQVVQNSAQGSSGETAIALLVKDHLASPGFGAALQRLTYSRQTSPGIERLFRAVLQKSEDRGAKGNATFGLAQYLKNQGEMAQRLKGADEERVKQFESYYGADVVKGLRELNTEVVNKEVEKLLEQVVEQYGDLQGPRGTLGEAAKPELFEIRFLSVGKVAPDIEGQDIDGETFKLTDYRGKVVMIDFWGHW